MILVVKIINTFLHSLTDFDIFSQKSLLPLQRPGKGKEIFKNVYNLNN